MLQKRGDLAHLLPALAFDERQVPHVRPEDADYRIYRPKPDYDEGLNYGVWRPFRTAER